MLRFQKYILPLAFSFPLFCQMRENPYETLKEAERLFWLDNWIKARPLYWKCEQEFERRGDLGNAMLARFSRLRADSETVLSYPEVSRLLAEDLRKPIVQNTPSVRLRGLIVKGTVDLSIHDPVNAAREWAEAQALAQTLGEKGWEERLKTELSIIAFLKGDTVKSVELNEAGYRAAKQLHDVAGQIRARSLKAVGLLEQGQAEEAQGYADEALALAKDNPEVRFPLMAYMAKSQALEVQGNKAGSLESLEQARHFVETSNMSVYKADLYVALGTKAEKAKDLTGARKMYERAATAAKNAGMPRPYSDALFHLTTLSMAAGDFPAAEKSLKEGLIADRKLIDIEFLPKHLATAAEIEAKLGKPRQAAAYYEEAGDLIESLLVNVPTVTVKSALIATMSEVYIGHFRLALTAEKNIPAAFRILEKARGRVVADRLRARPLWTNEPAVMPTPAEKKLAAVQRKLLSGEAHDRKALMQELFAVEAELTPVELARNRKTFTIGGDPVSLPKLQQLLKPDELLLEYAVDEAGSFCLAITRDSIQPRSLPGRAKLESLVKAYLAEIQSEAPVPAVKRTAARSVFDAILGPIPEYGSRSRLIVVPDSVLNQVAFDSLVTSQGDYVMRSHSTAYVPSATVLSLLRTETAPKPTPLTLLAFGDTKPAVQEQVSAKVSREQAPGKAPGTNVKRGMFDLEGATLSPLPSAAAEARAVAKIGGPASQLFLGEGATEAVFKSQPLGNFRVLHLATHAFTDIRFPDRSAILLTPDARTGDDGLLQVREIRGLHLNAELVTLSACDSGFGKMQGLDGMASLVNAFLFAGARSVVASLWAVDDTFTASLMTRFYTHLAAGDETETALRKAKLDLLDRFGEQAAPVYWAGFFVSGDGSRRISFKQ